MYVKYVCNEKPTGMHPLSEPHDTSRIVEMELTLADW